jgi:hypothetical protein
MEINRLSRFYRKANLLAHGQLLGVSPFDPDSRTTAIEQCKLNVCVGLEPEADVCASASVSDPTTARSAPIRGQLSTNDVLDG